MSNPEKLPVNSSAEQGASSDETGSMRMTLLALVEFVFYVSLLIIPLYAAVKCFIADNWLMMMVDVVIFPVGLIHGVLLLLGLAD